MHILGNQLAYTNSPGFDYMATPLYVIKIDVSDASLQGLPGYVNVIILDVPEPPAIASYPEVIAVPEDTALGTVVAQVSRLICKNVLYE